MRACIERRADTVKGRREGEKNVKRDKGNGRKKSRQEERGREREREKEIGMAKGALV